MSQELIEGFRLSPQQLHLWLAQSNKRAFRVQCVVEVRGPLKHAALREALRKVMSQHETLRTTFQCLPSMNVPLQVVSENAEVNLRVVDASNIDPGSRGPHVERLLKEEGAQHFSAQQEPLGRFTLLTFGEEEHFLLISLPALCADIRTLKNLVLECSRVYDAPLVDELMEEPLQYVQFSEWQHEMLTAEDAEAGREFWDAQKAKQQEPLSLPFDPGALSAAHTDIYITEPEAIALTFEAESVEQLKAMAERYNVSLSVFMLACWQALLWRLTGQRQVAVKTLFDGRKFKELQEAMGLFAKYLPVTSHFDENLRFNELLEKVGRNVDEINSWQEYFIEETESETTGDSVNGGRLPVGFEFEEWPAEFSAGDVSFSLLSQFVWMEEFKLKLSCLQVGQSLRAEIYYEPALYQPTVIQQLGDEFKTLLANILTDPQAQLGQVDILSENEKRLLLGEWNETRTEYNSDAVMHKLFEEQVERSPHATAVIFDEEQLSFGELNRRANQVAHYLRRLGVGPEASVCLLLERSTEMIVGLLGILKAGGGYVPLDPGQPTQRLHFMLADAQPTVILSQQSLASHLTGSAAKVVLIDSDWPFIAQESQANPDAEMSAENLAYVIYTSGSTGQPKGTMISHRSVVNLATALRASIYTQTKSPLKVSLNAPLAFDASVKQLIQLLDGHTLCIVPEETRRNGDALLQFIEQQKLDVLDCTPSHLKLLLAAGLVEKPSPQLMLIGGEAWDATTWGRLAEYPETQFFNVYGPTECTVNTSICALRNSPAQPTIGRPIANVRTYILDSGLHPVPVGVAGEIYIGGAGVARGYLNQPALTAERFLPDPFSGEPGARLYRSGDMARYLPDGNIEFLGRADNQVKVRGFRIELGEIESTIKQNPSVREAVVLAREDEPGDKRLVAYVVPTNGRAITANRAADYSLPNGMVIAHQNKNETDYLYEEIFQKQTYVQHGIELEDGCCVFDVGANIGMFTLFVSERCRDAHIYAFEPLLPIFEKLKINANLCGSHVELFNIGMSDAERKETFTYYPRYSMMSGTSAYANSADEVDVIKRFLSNEGQGGDADISNLLEHADELLAGRFENEAHECRLSTLSSVISENNIEQIDLLKIDVQRAELDVLNGIKEEDWPKIRQVVMEVHDAPGTQSEGRANEISDLLGRRGFAVVVEQDELLKGTDRYNLYAVHPERKAAAGGGQRAERAERYVVHFAQPALTVGELRDYLQERLPDYMIPQAFVMLEELPLTRNGKVDHAALPAPGASRLELDHEYVPPQTPTEKLMADIWGEVLGLERVSIHDSFFHLGGDSIRSIKLRVLCQKNGLDFSLQDIFTHQTIHELSQQISLYQVDEETRERTQPFSLISDEDRSKLPPDVEDAYPLSVLQLGMLFHSEYVSGSPMYYNSNTLHLKAPFDAGKMHLAIEQLMVRHPILRTSFRLTGFSRPLQLVHREARVPLVVEDLRALSPAVQQEIVGNIVESERKTKFDWAVAPLIRFKVQRRTDETFQFTWSEHHSILDGWSLASLTTELFQRYLALLENEQQPPLPSPVISYHHFVALEQQALKSEEDRSYWQQKLNDSTKSPLPYWQAETPDEVQQTRLHLVSIPVDISEGLKSLAQSAGVTIKSVLLAAHLKVMSLLSGQSDVLTGLVSNGRPEEADGDQVLGLFLNVLPFRMNLKGSSWLDLVRETFEAERELMPHRRYPMAQLQRELGGRPLFETMFNFTHFHILDILKGLEKVQVLEWESAVVDINLTLTANFELDPVSNDVKLNFQYDVRRISGDKMKAVGDYYVNALAAMVADPHGQHNSVSLLPAQERRLLLGEFNDTQAELDVTSSLHALFEAQVVRSPDAPALTYGQQSLTYSQLNERANRLAHLLINTGIVPESLVAILLPRSHDLVVALMAVLKAGAAYVPLDPSYPQQRLSFMLSDAGAPVLLTDEHHKSLLPPTSAQVICLDGEWPQPAAQQSPGNPEVSVSPGNLAYVIYTSGSTGKPKAAMNEHRAICNRLLWMQDAFELETTETVLQKTPYSFDVSVWEFFWPLLVGARLVLAEPGGHQDAAYLKTLVETEQVTTLHFVPSMLEIFLREEGLKQACRSVRRVVCSGEALSYDLQQRFYERMPESAELYNLYGPTEAAVDVSWWKCRPESEQRVVPIGKPIANTRLYVLDEQHGLVPQGVRGELYIGGIAVGRGYLNGAELTAERFLPDPFSAEAGARMYRTGDEVWQEEGGTIQYLGRVDQQVKLRGQRIELGEIEAALRQEREVREAVVVLRDGPADGDKRLVGYIVRQREDESEPVEKEAIRIGELRERLRERLPEYMIPAVLLELAEMPLTPSGKIDRKALPEPGGARPELQVEYVAPQTEIEMVLEGIWRRVLGVERVGINDNFFDLGVDSLLATQLVAQVNSSFQLEMPLRASFDNPTIHAMALLTERLLIEQITEQSLADSQVE